MSGEGHSNRKELIVACTKEIANSKAADKLASAVQGLVQLPHNVLDYIAGPERIRAVQIARADGLVAEARAQAEVERLRAETADFVLDREMQKTLNRRAILAEAQKSLPPPSETISDEPVSKDFIHNFFEEFDGISDPEVHKIVGRLLANEVVRPGSFPRRTMRVLRDLESSDFALFSSLCRLCWNLGDLIPLVYDPNGAIYAKHGLNFKNFSELDSLGLVTFNHLGFVRKELPKQFLVAYGSTLYQLTLAENSDSLQCGNIMFTEAGRKLAPLTHAGSDAEFMNAEFMNYVIEKWKDMGHTAILHSS